MAQRNCLSRPAVDCRNYPDTHCIVWSGANLPCISAVTNERLDSILTKINDKLCDLDSGEAGCCECYEINFRVGDEGYPGSGITSWTPKDTDDVAVLAGDKAVKLYRDGDRQYVDVETGYTLNTTTGQISFFPDLYKHPDRKGEWIKIEVCPGDSLQPVVTAEFVEDSYDDDYSSDFN